MRQNASHPRHLPARVELCDLRHATPLHRSIRHVRDPRTLHPHPRVHPPEPARGIHGDPALAARGGRFPDQPPLGAARPGQARRMVPRRRATDAQGGTGTTLELGRPHAARAPQSWSADGGPPAGQARAPLQRPIEPSCRPSHVEGWIGCAWGTSCGRRDLGGNGGWQDGRLGAAQRCTAVLARTKG